MKIDYSWLIYISIIAIGLILGVSKYRNLAESSRRATFLLGFILFIEIIAVIFKIHFGNNIPVYHFSTTFYIIIYLWLYNTELKLLTKIKLRVLFIVVLCISTFSAIHYQKFFYQFPSTIYQILSVVVLLICLVYLKQLLKTNTTAFFFDYPLCIISFGLLFFYSINLAGFGVLKFIYFQKNELFILFFSLLRKFSNYITYLCFIFAFYSKQKTLNI